MKKILVIGMCTVIVFTLILFNRENIEEARLKRRAIKYFCEKHDAKKKDITIGSNYLYGKYKNCFMRCDENTIEITYDNIKYTVKYDLRKDYFSDNTQDVELKYAISKRISDEYNEAIVQIDTQNIKYTSDDMHYKQVDNIENYVRGKEGFYGNLNITVLINVSNEQQAKEEYRMYAASLVQFLERFGCNYIISIRSIGSDELKDYYWTSPNYYYIQAYDNKFKFEDHIDNKNINGLRYQYIDGQFME